MTTITIALNMLLAWDGNVRRTEPDKGIQELAASIAAHGLLQSLVVRKDKRGRYTVVAGGRRLLALQLLVESDRIAANAPIACHVLDDGADATEVSLAENVQREAMHPADEFDAFRDLIEGGIPVADVAARFGVSETAVKQRLKLANVSPKLIGAYREGEMTLQQVMAFAVVDDHEAQERVWNDLPQWHRNDPDAIRGALTEHEITARDRRVKFVTLKAYEKAGGTVRRDLFSEDADGVFIEDGVLLENLVAKKLERAAASIRKQGWKWIEIVPVFNHAEWSKCHRRHPEPSPLPPGDQAEFDALSKEADALAESNERLDDQQQTRFDAISERLEELEERRSLVWPPETLAISGAVVTLGHDGEVDIRYGLVKPEDALRKPFKRKAASADGASDEEADRSPLPASLVESLTAQRSAAINAALLERPDLALAATVHVMASQVLYNNPRGETALQIAANDQSLGRVEGSPAATSIATAADRWSKLIPGESEALFAWCLTQHEGTLSQLPAFCAAQTVNAVLLKADRPDCARMMHADQLAQVLKLDMTKWFTPTAENYFSRISKVAIIDALREVKSVVGPTWSSMKKSELAALAEREVAGTGWLPAILRAPKAHERKSGE